MNVTVGAWRRLLIVAITTLVALLAVSASAPRDAHAIMDPTVVLSGHKGWVYVRTEPVMCPAIYPAPAWCSQPARIAAWRWTGKEWQSTTIAGGSRVYAWPYTGSWHWIWTSQTGWLAIQTAKLETGYRCTSTPCPVF